MTILVTGANGFVGNAILQRLCTMKVSVRGVVRSGNYMRPAGIEYITVGELGIDNDWGVALSGMNTVIHTAARVHVMNEYSADPLSVFRRINVQGTLNLARQAADAGVNRFIFISSIKVNGEGTKPDKPYSDSDTPAPIDPYGISKFETEVGLQQLSAETGMDVVIIRPPLVYGPGVKANFLSMLHWLYKGIPLPFGAIYNKRSLVALDNLVDLIVSCIDHPAAGNEIFLVSDGEDMSTTELMKRTGKALGKPARLLPVPVELLKTVAILFGKRDVAQRLLGSLQVDINKTRKILGWSPPISVDEGLEQTARWYIQNREK